MFNGNGFYGFVTGSQAPGLQRVLSHRQTPNATTAVLPRVPHKPDLTKYNGEVTYHPAAGNSQVHLRLKENKRPSEKQLHKSTSPSFRVDFSTKQTTRSHENHSSHVVPPATLPTTRPSSYLIGSVSRPEVRRSQSRSYSVRPAVLVGAPPGMASFFATMSRITDHVYLSGCTAVTETNLLKNNVRLVVNATMDMPNLALKGVEWLNIRVDDVPHARLNIFFDRVREAVNQCRSNGGNVLIHCIAGVSRSATLVISYMMREYNMTLLDAYRHVRAKRPIIRPNIGFWKQLIELEKRLHNGRSTVNMVDSNMGLIPDVYRDEAKNMVRL